MSIARHIETDSLSNQNISSALAVGSYTADADRMVIVQVLADQVAGNGDYEFYLTLQVGGSGSHYRLIPITSAEAASGVTAVGAQSGMVAVRSGDVLTCYLKGLAGDNATPDTIVRWFELDALQPATAGRTLAVDAAGGVALAASQGAVTFAGQVKITANVSGQGALHIVNSHASGHGEYAQGGTNGQYIQGNTNGQYIQGNSTGQYIYGVYTGQHIYGGDTAQYIQGLVAGRTINGYATTLRLALGMAAADLDAQLDAIAACGAGSGAVSYPITVNNESSNPIDGVEVWVSTDSAGTNVVAGTLSTDASGIVTFMLDAGSYYVWRQKSGYNFANPVAITVT